MIECTRFARTIQQYRFIQSRTLHSRPEQSFCPVQLDENARYDNLEKGSHPQHQPPFLPICD
ncbi:hypothetical protein WH47_04198 [Habropoda laboriosa]|uniref:Uncharacterized protein n=1 Tax=Habropoda laboriosa TaxID=597456 RepID=A0A0L7QV51_9HYME|nr:hypothetical protein WH47_04198 [Habropoda laboriosa]